MISAITQGAGSPTTDRPILKRTIASTLTLRSRETFWLLTVGACVYYYVLFSPSQAHDWVYAIYAGIGLMFPYGLWASTYEVVIDGERIVIKRAFGLIEPIVVDLKQITELRSHLDSTGRITRFEIWTRRGRTVQLHMFQTNFLAGVAAVRTARADLDERVLGVWSM